MRFIYSCALLIVLLLTQVTQSWAVSSAGDFHVPELTGPVVDDARVIDRASFEELNANLRALYERGGSQIQILTVNGLEGLPIETVSLLVVEKWRLGTKKSDNGILVLVAPNERKVRIEVGRGREGLLTDMGSGQIVREVMIPYFKQNLFGAGVVAGARAIVTITDSEYAWSGEALPRLRRRRSSEISLPVIVVWAVLMLIFAVLRFLRRRDPRNRGYYSSGGWGGGFGGGGGSGGGWSGGGGGFSGGGASGGW